MKTLKRFFPPLSWKSGRFTNDDGQKIRYGYARPKGEPKGTVVMTTGYADFTESYYETIHDYLDRGFSVWIMDWAGQGGSDKGHKKSKPAPVKQAPERKIQNGMDHHVRDLHHFRSKIVVPEKNKPVFLSTHSMGGHIGMHYLKKHPGQFDFAVMAAPFFDFSMHPGLSHITRGILNFVDHMGMGGHSVTGGRKKLVRTLSENRKKRQKEEPVRMNLHKVFVGFNRFLRAEDPTWTYLAQVFNSKAELNREDFLNQIKTPVLIGLAGKEDIVNNKATRQALKHLPKGEGVDLPDAMHGIWTERQHIREQWWRHVDDFIHRQTGIKPPQPKPDSRQKPSANDDGSHKKRGNRPDL